MYSIYTHIRCNVISANDSAKRKHVTVILIIVTSMHIWQQQKSAATGKELLYRVLVCVDQVCTCADQDIT